MLPQTLLMALVKSATVDPTVDGDANASKTGAYNGTASSFTIPSVGTSGADSVIVAAFSVVTNTGLTLPRTISSISGYATAWTLVQRKAFTFVDGSSRTFTSTEEVWLGKKAVAAAAADVTVTMSGTVSDHVVYNLKTFNNIDQTNMLGSDVVGGQNATTTPTATSLNLTSVYTKGVELSIIQTPNAFTPAVVTSGFSEQDASGSKLATSRISQAWKLYSGTAPTSDPVSWGSQQMYSSEAFTLRASGQLSQPTSAPNFIGYNLSGALDGSFNIDATAGDFMIATVHASKAGGTAPTVSSVSSSPALTWTKLTGVTIPLGANSETYEIWYARAAATTTYTCTSSWTATPTSQTLEVHLFGGVNTTEPFDTVAGTFTQSGASSVNFTGSVTSLRYNNSLIMANLGTTTPGAGPNDTGWATWGGVQSGPNPQSCQDHWRRTQATAGDYTWNWGANTNMIFYAVVLKGTGGGS